MMPDKGLSPIDYLEKIEEENLLVGLGGNEDLKLDQVNADMKEARKACENGDQKIFWERLLKMIERNSRWHVSQCKKTNNIGRTLNYITEALKAYFRQRIAVRMVLTAIGSIVLTTGTIFGVLGVLGVFSR